MIHLIIDSTSAISKEQLAAHENLHVVPLQLSFGHEFINENDTSIKDVIDYSEREKKAVSTSQPSTGAFLEVIHSIPEEDGIIIIALTSGVSGTYNGAVLAAKQSGRKQIAVINSRTTAIGMVQMLEDAFDYIGKGLPFEEIAVRLEQISFRMHTTFVPTTLEYLRRGGRIGKAAGLIGTILKIRPVIFLNEKNEVDVLDKVRTQKKASARMIQYLHEHSPCRHIGIVHVENPEGAEVLREEVQAEYPHIHVTVSPGTPVLAAYLGPGLTGIIFEQAESGDL